VCAQPTCHGKRSATPTLFPFPCGHPTDLSFLCDFCWGMYRFPAIHVRTFPFATVSAMVKPGCQYFFQTYSPGGVTIRSPICSGILTTAHFLVAVFTFTRNTNRQTRLRCNVHRQGDNTVSSWPVLAPSRDHRNIRWQFHRVSAAANGHYYLAIICSIAVA